MSEIFPTYRVGVRLLDWAQGFGNRIYGGILDFIRAGHPLELVFEQPSGGEFEPVHIGKDWEGDGLLVFRYTEEEAAAWKARGISVVNLSAEQPDKGIKIPRVTLDNQRCGEMAAEHLLSLGLKNFGFWNDPARRYSTERLAGFRQAIEAAGYEVEILDVAASTYPAAIRPRQIRLVADKAVRRLKTPCGLFAKDDIAAVCAVKALRAAGIRVPQDVAVLGVADDLVFCHTTTPPLSSLRFPARMIGYEASKLLYQMMRGETIDPESRLTIPPRGVVVRESTGNIELADLVVTKALKFIRNQAAAGNLDVSTVCKAVGVSRESLRQKFRDTLGRSIKEEIDSVRVLHICDRLQRTSHTLDQLSIECGFSSGDELCRFFKRLKGVSPRQWRREH